VWWYDELCLSGAWFTERMLKKLAEFCVKNQLNVLIERIILFYWSSPCAQRTNVNEFARTVLIPQYRNNLFSAR
jgi:hypothetical protein